MEQHITALIVKYEADITLRSGFARLVGEARLSVKVAKPGGGYDNTHTTVRAEYPKPVQFLKEPPPQMKVEMEMAEEAVLSQLLMQLRPRGFKDLEIISARRDCNYCRWLHMPPPKAA